MSYHHFSIDKSKSILIYRMQSLNFSQIAKLLHRHPSSISREWKRHTKLPTKHKQLINLQNHIVDERESLK